MGGDCLNVGCVPSKGLIRASRAWANVRNAGEFGVQIPDGVRYDFGAAMSRMMIEIQDSRGKVIASGGPFNGGNTWGEFTVDIPPRTRFILVIKNYVSTWLYIDTLEMRR